MGSPALRPLIQMTDAKPQDVDFGWVAQLIVLTQKHVDLWAKCDSEAPEVTKESMEELWSSAGDIAAHLREGEGMTEH